VSIRPGWFWHEAENARVKKPAQLTSLYYQSVGRGATLLLNVPPNRDGLLAAEDIASLRGFGAYLKGTFGQNLAARARADATHVRGNNDKQFGPAHLLDGRPDTFWATDDKVTSADVTIDLGRPEKFQAIRLKEAIRFGQRIDGFTLERWQSGSWEPLVSSTGIGPRRVIHLAAPIIATRLRLRIAEASASPALSEFAVFAEAAPG
jgi:alpha-L-fucosidase